MRSLHVSDSSEGGGAEVSFRATVAAAKDLGHSTHVFTADGSRNPLSYVFSLRNARSFLKRLREFDPDVVHIHNFYHFLSPSILWALRRHRRGRPHVHVVFTAHDFHLICPNSGFQHFVRGRAVNYDPARPHFRLTDRFDGRSIAYSVLKLLQHGIAYRLLRLDGEIDTIVTPSHFLERAFRAAGVTTRMIVVRNPVDLPSPDPEASASRDGFVYIGRVAPEKGLVEFVALADKAGRALTVDVFGDGPDINAVENASRQSRVVSMNLKGAIPHAEVPQTLARYRTLIFCSTWLENAPISIIEAAAAGLGLVVVEGGGGQEMAALARSYHGYRHGDAVSLRRALDAAGSDSEPNGINEPGDFSAEAYKHALDTVYRMTSPRTPSGV